MINETYASFSEFIGKLAQKKLDGRSIFRGQRDAAWKLENRWKRFQRDFLPASAAGSAVRNSLREAAIIEFRSSGYAKEGMSETEIEAICQHAGLPTRLMDWTYSPYAALFFAFDAANLSPSSASECAVVEIDVENFVFSASFAIDGDEAAALHPSAREHAFASSVNVTNPRILLSNDRGNTRAVRQEGIFVVLPDRYSDLEQYEAECMGRHARGQFLTKHILANGDRINAIRHLQAMNTKAANIYADPSYSAVDGAFRALAFL